MQVWLVAVDLAGNAQSAPTLTSVQTAPDTTAPALLAGSGPNSVSHLDALLRHGLIAYQAGQALPS